MASGVGHRAVYCSVSDRGLAEVRKLSHMFVVDQYVGLQNIVSLTYCKFGKQNHVRISGHHE